MLEMNKWGKGDYCEDGNKAYCGEASSTETENSCYWTCIGGSCNEGELPLTSAGTFPETVADIASFGGLKCLILSSALSDIDMDIRHLYWCPSDGIAQWENCDWHGDPGS